MSKELYSVTIPTVLANLAGRQNIREQIEDATRGLFDEWAHPSLVKKIQVTKPRTKSNDKKVSDE
jgi:hypothetical protein